MPMRIEVVWGKSEGVTKVSAFDNALMQAGIHNLNLLALSSVIPADAIITQSGVYTCRHKIGDIIYVVLASISCNKPDTQISAGLGWCQTKVGGLFYETEGEFSESECTDEIIKGLSEMLSVRGWEAEIHTKVITHLVETTANVTVAAVYQWD